MIEGSGYGVFVNVIFTDKNIKSFGNTSGEERTRRFTIVLM